jgi:hypothetical protein
VLIADRDSWLKSLIARRFAAASFQPSADLVDDPAPEADPVPNYRFVRSLARDLVLLGAPTVLRAKGVLFAGEGASIVWSSSSPRL